MSHFDALQAELHAMEDLLKGGRRGEKNKLPGDVEYRDSRGRRYFAPPKTTLDQHPVHQHLAAAEQSLRTSGHHDDADRIAAARRTLGKPKRRKPTSEEMDAHAERNPTPISVYARNGWTEEGLHSHYANHSIGRLRTVLRQSHLATDTDMEGLKRPELMQLLVDRTVARWKQNTA